MNANIMQREVKTRKFIKLSDYKNIQAVTRGLRPKLEVIEVKPR